MAVSGVGYTGNSRHALGRKERNVRSMRVTQCERVVEAGHALAHGCVLSKAPLGDADRKCMRNVDITCDHHTKEQSAMHSSLRFGY
jgi:hypothetical protein